MPPFRFPDRGGHHRAFLSQAAEQIFISFEREPVASASIAQVHFARVRDKAGVEHDVAVKVLRPA